MCIVGFGGTDITGIVRARYTLEFKQEAVRLVRGGQSLSSVARGLGVSAQSIDNWMKADAVGGLKEAKGKPVNADQMEIARLKADLAKTRMERDILKKAAAYLARESKVEIRLCRATREPLADHCAMPGSGRERQRLPSTISIGHGAKRRISRDASAIWRFWSISGRSLPR